MTEAAFGEGDPQPGTTGDGLGAGGKLENLTLWQRVYEYLREEILSERLRSGTELQEVALARELGVSRGPLREAIGRLQAEGLVTVRPRRGAVVRSLSRAEFLELYQVREALEAAAIRLAVPRLGKNGIARLRELTDEMAACAQAERLDEFFEANAAFHDTIFIAAGNRKLREMYRQLVGQMGRYRTRSVSLRGSLQRSVLEHRAVVKAAAAGDADAAARLLSEHIRVPQLRLQELTDDELLPILGPLALGPEPEPGLILQDLTER
jgi:DNA-binding GntR family transcriptional regulator